MVRRIAQIHAYATQSYAYCCKSSLASPANALHTSFADVGHSEPSCPGATCSVAVGNKVLLRKCESVLLLEALGVFTEDVDFDVKQGTERESTKAGGGVGVGNDGDFDLVACDGRDREADAFDGNGPLFDDIPREIVGDREAKAVVSF